MPDISSLYKASAKNFYDTMVDSHAGQAGFRIPEYQRPYSWGEENISDLLEAISNGLQYLSEDEQSLTFIGTLILVSEKSESSFAGQSLAIVDGQQRLTTLVLTVCALIETIERNQGAIQHLSEKARDWLEEEVGGLQELLRNCISGDIDYKRESFSFPRIIRSGDTRARRKMDSEYTSAISDFIYSFGTHYDEGRIAEFQFSMQDNDANNESERKKILQSYKFIQEQVKLIESGEIGKRGQSDIDFIPITANQFGNRNIRKLFLSLQVCGDGSEQDRAISEISNSTVAEPLIRLVLFSVYLLNRVVLIRLETENEDSAFGIFDSHNTQWGVPRNSAQCR